jgi:hypothetical protein
VHDTWTCFGNSTPSTIPGVSQPTSRMLGGSSKGAFALRWSSVSPRYGSSARLVIVADKIWRQCSDVVGEIDVLRKPPNDPVGFRQGRTRP